MRFFILSFLLLFTACGVVEERDVSKEELVLHEASYMDLETWQEKDHVNALLAFQRSCVPILKRDPAMPFGTLEEAGTNDDWQKICRRAMAIESPTRVQAKLFFEKSFQPYQAKSSHRGKTKGLFTGYYEAGLKGSLRQHGPYQYPLYTKPDDLVMVNLGDFRDGFKGERIAGRVVGGYLKPYEDREKIDAGQWPHNDHVLVWTDDPVDVFFLHIQGSGIVELDSGKTMRVGYAGQNGHPYYAIGRELIKRGHLDKDEVSLQTISAWLKQHPVEGREVMNTNKSYIFFQELVGDGPLGGSGVALLAGRSLAIDRSLIPYGVPIWLDIDQPTPGAPPLQRLMVAQDTGGAIRGPVRGDVFWGYGDRAEDIAGKMKAEGQYWLLLPRQ